jgi:hypothetical protein
MLAQHIKLIEEFYGDECAERSGIPKINHIREGLIILEDIYPIEADPVFAAVHAAWCIHPIVQSNSDFMAELKQGDLIKSDPAAIMLAVEYRNLANAYLSKDPAPRLEGLSLQIKSGLVWGMLVADKVQNYKDFRAQPKGTYENESRLREYFMDWICDILGLSMMQLQRYNGLIDGTGNIRTHAGSGKEEATSSSSN